MTLDAAQATANATIASFMERLAAFMEPHFPLHAMALRGEVIGHRLSTDRWNRIAAVLASLHAVPGVPLVEVQHDARNAALSAIVVAQKMAAAGFIWKDPQWSRDMALWRAAEISVMMAQSTQTRTSE